MFPNELPTIRAFLKSQSTLALATVGAEGNPQVAPLFYVSDDALNLYWLSSPDSRHSVNLLARSRVAATIYPKAWHWTEIHGVQVEGSAQPVNDDSLRSDILARYAEKFDLPSGFETIITGSTLYILKPGWVRWLDNGVHFGYKCEVQI